MQLGQVPYLEAWDLQRSLAAEVARGGPDTIVFLEHLPVITLGRRTEPGELHVPEGAEVEIDKTGRGGKSTHPKRRTPKRVRNGTRAHRHVGRHKQEDRRQARRLRVWSESHRQ